MFRINNKYYDTVEEMTADVLRVVTTKLKREAAPLPDLKKIAAERDALVAKLLADGHTVPGSPWPTDEGLPLTTIQIKGTNVFLHVLNIRDDPSLSRPRLEREAKCCLFGWSRLSSNLDAATAEGSHDGEGATWRKYESTFGPFRPAIFAQRLQKELTHLAETKVLKEMPE